MQAAGQRTSVHNSTTLEIEGSAGAAEGVTVRKKAMVNGPAVCFGWSKFIMSTRILVDVQYPSRYVGVCRTVYTKFK